MSTACSMSPSLRCGSSRRRAVLPVAIAAVACSAVATWTSTALHALVAVRPAPAPSSVLFGAAPGIHGARGSTSTTIDDSEALREARRALREALSRNSTATLESETTRRPLAKEGSELQSPPWATCFVEHISDGSQVWEEWLLRGETASLEEFRAWQQALRWPGSAAVRCEEGLSPQASFGEDSTVCLECFAPSSMPANSLSWAGQHASSVTAVATVQAELVASFVDLKECMSATVGGRAFCNSGRVTMPR
mmetsp:Transcript_76622/g.247980  ORF Transcript_76622/g.247980 Transcript_76622/m.247980 type:complete len:251 (-) Transcript_76622:260-1012(-)